MAVLKSSISCFQQLLKIQPERSPFQKIFPNNCIVSYSRPPFVTLQSIAAKTRGNVNSISFVFCTVNVTMSDCQYSQCQNATMSQYSQCQNATMSQYSQCHNIPNISMSHYSQYINVTRSKYFTMSQCHNVTLFTISRCHNEQSTHLAPHSAMTKPAAEVTSRCNTVETGDLCASLGCMGKM